MVRHLLRQAGLPWLEAVKKSLFARPFVAVGHAYTEAAKRHPFTTGIITTTLKTSAADLFAQKVVEKREEIDLRRHLTFCCFGFAYLGGFQYYLYNNLFQRLCHPLTTAGYRSIAILSKVVLDQGLHHPFVYFPSFYAIKTFVEGKPLVSAVDKYRTEIWSSLQACWTVWVPAQIINFAFVPKHFRIPYVALVSFGWTVILSVMQGAFDEKIKARSESAATPALGLAAPPQKN